MTSTPELSRRRLLRLLGAAPMLPLSGFAATSLLAGCG